MTINDLHNDSTLAWVSNGVTINAGGTLDIAAQSTLLDITIAGVSADASANSKDHSSGDGSALAGAFAWDNLGLDTQGNERNVEAYADDAILHVTHLVVSADNLAQLFTFAVGGALAGGSGKVGLIGSVSLDQLDFNTLAEVRNGTTLLAGDGITPADVTIDATSTILLVSAAGGAAYAGQYGIGAGADVGIINDAVTATIGSGTDIEPTGNVSVIASASETVVSVAADLAIAKQGMGIVGAGAVVFLNPTVQAYIAAGATVKTSGNLLVDATDGAFMVVVGGEAAIGKNLGIGASIGYGGITLVDKAYIGAGAVIVAEGNGAAVSNPSNTVSGNGVLINADGHEALYVFGAGGSGSERVAFAGSGAATNLNNDIEAYIGDGASLNSGVTALAADDALTIRAHATVGVLSVAGDIAIAINTGSKSSEAESDGTGGSDGTSNESCIHG